MNKILNVDTIASVLLVGAVSSIVGAQLVKPPTPVPVTHRCSAGSVVLFGETHTYPAIDCPEGTNCGIDVEVDFETQEVTVTPACQTPPV